MVSRVAGGETGVLRGVRGCLKHAALRLNAERSRKLLRLEDCMTQDFKRLPLKTVRLVTPCCSSLSASDCRPLLISGGVRTLRMLDQAR